MDGGWGSRVGGYRKKQVLTRSSAGCAEDSGMQVVEAKRGHAVDHGWCAERGSVNHSLHSLVRVIVAGPVNPRYRGTALAVR
jgi:hypothetical protein